MGTIIIPWVVKHSSHPKSGLAFALAPESWSLAPASNVLTDRSVFICLGALATRQSNNVIYDGGFGPWIIRFLDELETKGISLLSGRGWRLNGGQPHGQYVIGASKYSGHQRLGWLSLVGSARCVLSHIVAKKGNAKQFSTRRGQLEASHLDPSQAALWVSSFG